MISGILLSTYEILASLTALLAYRLFLYGDKRGLRLGILSSTLFLVLFLGKGMFAAAFVQVVYALMNLHALSNGNGPDQRGR